MELLISQILESERLSQAHSALNITAFLLDALVEYVIKDYYPENAIGLELSHLTITTDKMHLHY